MREPLSQRLYMFFIGSVLLLALYFELSSLLYALVAMVILEAVTNVRIAQLFSKLVGTPASGVCNVNSPKTTRARQINFDADRAWQLSMGPILIVSYMLGNALWFIPWFIGFTVLGAGLSGVCPWLIALRAMGFK